jgi:hypothetical protein
VICRCRAKSSARVRFINSVRVYARIFVSFVFDRDHRGLLAKAPEPKEAGRIACDRNEEEECAALAAATPTRGV